MAFPAGAPERVPRGCPRPARRPQLPAGAPIPLGAIPGRTRSPSPGCCPRATRLARASGLRISDRYRFRAMDGTWSFPWSEFGTSASLASYLIGMILRNRLLHNDHEIARYRRMTLPPCQPIQRTAIVFLRQIFDADVFAHKVMSRLRGQQGGKLLAGVGTARNGHRFDARRPVHVAAKIILLADNGIVAAEHRPRMDADAHGRGRADAEILPAHLLGPLQ